METIEKIQDYLNLLKKFEYINKSSGMQTILFAAGPGKQYLNSWNNYAVFYLKYEIDILVRDFSGRNDRVILIEKITLLIENFSNFANYAYKELLKFQKEAFAFAQSENFSLQDKQKVDRCLLIISEALER